MRDVHAWAEAQFGHAVLGDARRTQRLVRLAAEVAERPSGVVSQACGSSATREGAFRFLENRAVSPGALLRAVRQRTLQDCQAHATVLVPVDGSSLTIDDDGQKGLGGVGSWERGARGVQTMNALAVTPDGRAVGICSQRMWVRTERSKCKPYEGPTSRSESRFWLEMLTEIHQAFANAGDTKPWFQMDRGADCWPLLKLAGDLGALLTVRAVYNRTLDTGAHLWSTLRRAKVIAKRQLQLPARPPIRKKKRIGGGQRISYLTAPRKARTACVTIRAATVNLVCNRNGRPCATVPVNAVLVRETGAQKERLEWLLLTTHSIATRRDVLAVVDSYAMRWRIEDFHRAWKRGLCRVEETQLRSRDAIFKWATILATVATRAMRLTQLARQNPDALATTEFSEHELDAIVALRRPKDFDDRVLSSLTLGQAVRWVADIGGYTGPWNGPPGATVIGRGLYDVLVTARALAYRAGKR